MDHADGSCTGKMKNSEDIPLGEQLQIDNVRNRSEIDNGDSGTQQPQNDNNNIQEAQMPVKEESMKYNMSHQSRGKLLIFNHENFYPSTKRDKRSGTKKDVEKIEQCFRAIGYNIETCNDFTVEQINTRIMKCRDEDHNNCDSLAVFVLTHGKKDKLLAKDDWYDPAEVLWGNLTSDKCPSLAGKPKIIFIQACLGKKLDPGIRLVDRPTPMLSQFDNAPSSYTLPVCADFLIGYSTFDGYKSFRNDTNGSIWVATLCKLLKEHYAKLDIYSILTLVNKKVAIEFKSDNWRDESKTEKKLAPYFRSSLIRGLVFGEKRRY